YYLRYLIPLSYGLSWVAGRSMSI
ncbi:hypothetical protein AZ014_001874, partial [Klebsiella pneumoniae]